MIKEDFKIGDTVICVNNEGYEETLDIGAEYPVLEKWYTDGQWHPRIGLNGVANGFKTDRFKLKEEPLPDLEPTMYLEEVIQGSDNRLHVVDAKEYDQLLLIMEHRSYGCVFNATHLKLNADEALNLAHDITRMAMQIKRRTK